MRRPRFIAKQAQHASGVLGCLIAFIMARETWGENVRAIDALGVGTSDAVLDLGCGHGRSLSLLATKAASGRVVGVDPSDLMIDIAHRRNRDLIREGRVELAVATAGDLPFSPSSFDKALCVHVIYFWSDLQGSLRSLARVMKPGGRAVFVFRSDADTNAVAAFPAEIYRFRPASDVVTAFEDAGFAVEQCDEEDQRPVLLIATRR